jgi:hypothetical protein
MVVCTCHSRYTRGIGRRIMAEGELGQKIQDLI